MSELFGTLVDSTSQLRHDDINIDVFHVETVCLALNSPLNFLEVEFLMGTVSFNNILFRHWRILAGARATQFNLLRAGFFRCRINDL